ncbi:MAG: M1 family peptidase [Planctomycetes bacterium]|nr:M1 family peptidase [Planctomycetota bacterium]
MTLRSLLAPFFAPLLAFFVSALLLESAAAQQPDSPDFRSVHPRAGDTIFSPLQLPTPTSMRNGAGRPGEDYWQQTVDYKIQAQLDPGTRLVIGKATITYHNASPDDLDYLWMNLEQNVFRSDSIGARVGRRAAIGMQRSEGVGYRLHSMSSDGATLPFQIYDTLARVELPTPIAAKGGTFQFEVMWDFVIPANVFRRFGIEDVEQGRVIQIAQWFPAVAVYDDVHGWNTLPYIGTGEFYTNFGTHELELTAPRGWIIAATGELLNPEEVLTPTQLQRWNDAKHTTETVTIIAADEVGTAGWRPAGNGPLTWKFHAENVRTSAWSASDAFIWDAASLYEGTPPEGCVNTIVQSVYPKEGLPLWGQSTQMLATAIRGYNERWFAYPYPSAINVNGIEGGMEYPMIIFCRSRRSERGLYGVTAHEIGHNWFPMIVNTDERRHAWMDEGFNTFINYYSVRDWFPDSTGGRANPASVANLLTMPNQLPVETPADHLPGRLLGSLQYTKTGAGLVLLRETILGPERFDYAFRKYIQDWSFKSPRPSDFFRCMEDAAGADLSWFWRGWFLETGHLDQSLESFTPATESKPASFSVRNLGKLVMPVMARIEFEDGTSEDLRLPVEVWYHSHVIQEQIRSRKPVAKITLDPDRELPDGNRRNNVWPSIEG